MCSHLTLKGKQCRMNTKNGDTFCFLHKPSSRNEECSICHEEICSQCKTLECGHEFHRKCITTWKNRGNYTCPMCRQPFCEIPKKYRITVEIENISRELTRSFTLDNIPQFIETMGILSDDAYFTEARFEVYSEDVMRQVLDDLGIRNQHDLL